MQKGKRVCHQDHGQAKSNRTGIDNITRYFGIMF